MRAGVFLLLAFSLPVLGQTSSGNAKTSGSCSPAITGNNNTIKLDGCGISDEQGKKIVALLHAVLANRDLAAVSTKLDELLALANKPNQIQNCVGSACAQGPGSQATFNQLGSPLPKVTATAQVQRQTGDPNGPWQTVFTITSNVAVQTGDLRLKCSGPVIRAGISRINPYSFMSGTNGPNPLDPNEIIYELGPEPLPPGKVVTIAVYSKNPIVVISGSIGQNAITF